MNFKYNPWLSLVAMVLLALILVLACTGCHVQENATALEPQAETETETWPRFTREYAGGYCIILTDTQTGVQYLYYGNGTGGGLCVLEPGDG